MKNTEIKRLNHIMRMLQKKYRYYQNLQIMAKYACCHYNEFTILPEIEFQNNVHNEIAHNRNMLKTLETEIKECRKLLKNANRNQNKRVV